MNVYHSTSNTRAAMIGNDKITKKNDRKLNKQSELRNVKKCRLKMLMEEMDSALVLSDGQERWTS